MRRAPSTIGTGTAFHRELSRILERRCGRLMRFHLEWHSALSRKPLIKTQAPSSSNAAAQVRRKSKGRDIWLVALVLAQRRQRRAAERSHNWNQRGDHGDRQHE